MGGSRPGRMPGSSRPSLNNATRHEKPSVFFASISLSVLQPRLLSQSDFPRLNQAGEVLEGAVVGRLPFRVEAAPGEFP